MATYHGRRAPNFSQYLRDLNEVSPQEPALEENLNLEDELAMFTNTQFFDWDAGQNLDMQPPAAKPESEGRQASTTSPEEATSPTVGDLNGLDFMSGDFSYPEINSYTTPTQTQFPENLGNLLPLQPNAPGPYSNGPHPHQGAYPPAPQAGDKRKADTLNVHSKVVNFEEESRYAAEEDKRKRNTAASARFRVKKKAREQALEKSAKELNDKVSSLEGRIQHLETENKWLRELVMEKTGGNDAIVSALLKEYSAKSAALKPSSETKAESEKKSEDMKTGA